LQRRFFNGQSAIDNQQSQEEVMKYLCLLIVMMTAVIVMAADTVGRVSSSGPLTLNGKAVPTTAVASLPVVAGDEIVTSGSSAMIYFTDRSRATVEPNSRVKLEVRSASVALRVMSGSADLKRAEGSRVSLILPTHPAAADSADGRGSGQHDPPPGKDPRPHGPPKPPPPPPPRSRHCPPDHPNCD
jgi:hypothetical protein